MAASSPSVSPVRRGRSRVLLGAGVLALALGLTGVTTAPGSAETSSAPPGVPVHGERFQRLATLPAYANSVIDDEAAAEIAAATADGDTVVYTDSPGERLGIVDVSDLRAPRPGGTVALSGEPTSVDVLGNLALVAVNTSASFTEPSGVLEVVDLGTRAAVATLDLGGQPDAVDVSPDGRFAAVAIENERDEEVDDGALPQLPGGHLAVVDLGGSPGTWAVRTADLTGLAEIAPEDPEPEYVSVNDHGQAVVTLQENNHLVVVDLEQGTVVSHFSAGEATVEAVDTATDGAIRQDGTVTAVREPDAVAWLDDTHVATADEGDLAGGSRTWTVFDAGTGDVVFSSGNELEHLAVRYGQDPEHRAGDGGVEPEGIAVATFGKTRYAFVGTERANLVAVYRVGDVASPELVQALPTGVGPEGLLPLPQRDALVVSAEEESAEDAMRASVSTYQLTSGSFTGAVLANEAAPTIVAAAGDDGTPVGFGALSGLASLPGGKEQLVTVTDSAYTPTRILAIDVRPAPAVVHGELVVTKGGDPAGYDAEGIAARDGGGFWLAAEGDPENDLANLLVEVGADGAVRQEVALPAAVAAGATGNGFEGVTAVRGPDGAEQVWVAVQREWADNEPGQATLARYTPATGEWAFAAYPLEPAPAGGWVGLSELTALDDGTMLVLERDNQRGGTARLKAVYAVDVSAVEAAPAGQAKPLVAKERVLDLLPALAAGGGVVHDKPEGLAVSGGQAFVAVDNDGLEDAPGESVLLRLELPD